MIPKPQRPRASDDQTNRAIDALAQPVEALVKQANLYLPPVYDYYMGYCNQMMLAANLFTPFLFASSQNAFFGDSVDNSIIEIQLIYYSTSTVNFTIRLKEAFGTNPVVLFQQGIQNAPVTVARNYTVAKFAVGQCVTKADNLYTLEMAPLGAAGNTIMAAHIKATRGTTP